MSASAIKAGRVFVELFADSTKLQRGLKRAQAKLTAFGSTLRRVGMPMVGLGAAVITPMLAATKVFAGFDDQMRAVKAVLGATEVQFTRLAGKAKLLGRTTSYSASEVAGAMLELGRAGFDTDQIDAATASVLDLARATGTDLAESANLAAGIMRAFNVPASQTGQISDVLTATANNSAQTLTDLGEAMKYAAPVADAYGMTLQQTAKAVGALANFSIRGSMAGNTLKNIMLKLAKSDVREKLQAMGVASTDAQGKLLSVDQVLANLGRAITDMPDADRLAIMNELFGERAVAGGIKLTTANFEKLNSAIDNAAGTAARTAGTMDSGIGGAIRRLWSAAEGAAIAVGEALAPTLTALAETIGSVTGWLTKFISNNRQLVVWLFKIAAVVTLAGGALIVLGGLVTATGVAVGALASLISGATVVIGLIGSAVGLLVTPIGAVIAAIAALGGYLLWSTGAGRKAIGWLMDRFGDLKAKVTDVFAGITDAMAAGDWQLAGKILWLALQVEWQKGVNLLMGYWRDMKRFFVETANEMIYGAAVAFVEGSALMRRVWINAITGLTSAWTSFQTNFRTGWMNVSSWWAKRINEMRGAWDESFNADEANKGVERQRKKFAEQMKVERKEQLAKTESDRKTQLDETEQHREQTIVGLMQDDQSKKNQRDQAYRQQLEDSQSALDVAKSAYEVAKLSARAKQTMGQVGRQAGVEIEKSSERLQQAREKYESRLDQLENLKSKTPEPEDVKQHQKALAEARSALNRSRANYQKELQNHKKQLSELPPDQKRTELNASGGASGGGGGPETDITNLLDRIDNQMAYLQSPDSPAKQFTSRGTFNGAAMLSLQTAMGKDDRKAKQIDKALAGVEKIVENTANIKLLRDYLGFRS